MEKNQEICKIYSNSGICPKNNCDLLHKDCNFFNNTQTCKYSKKCKFFHRKVCAMWKSHGECFVENCQNLHKDCPKVGECITSECPFFHRACDPKLQLISCFTSLMESFKKQCLICKEQCICIYLSCGHQKICLKCYNSAEKKLCPSCKQEAPDFIC